MTQPARETSRRRFLFGFLTVAFVLAALISPFASDWADGLEAVAAKLGFIEHADAQPPVLESPLPDYTIPGVENEGLSTSLAGVAGTLATLLVMLALGWGIAARKKAGSAE